MHPYDSQKAARVWQRVQAGHDTPQETPQEDRYGNLQDLIMKEWNGAATYRQLARQLGPREGQVLQHLAREEQAHGACLRGIHHLITGSYPVTVSPRPETGTPESVLRKCYGNQMRSLKEYEARIDDPEYGPVFRHLAEQEREQCRLILELIGNLKQKK